MDSQGRSVLSLMTFWFLGTALIVSAAVTTLLGLVGGRDWLSMFGFGFPHWGLTALFTGG